MADKAAPILLVEDSMDDFEATVRAFKKAELANRLDHADSGEAALAYLRAGSRPCLIVLDLNMPGMGGRKFLENIKKDPAHKDIPVVVLTTSNYEPDIKACYALGANAYILKSADFAVLAASIKRLKEYWLDTVVLPVIFDEELSGGTGFSVSGGPGPHDMAPTLNAVHLPPEEVRNKIMGPAPQTLDPGVKLSPHEVETLLWIARGKSRWETGVILGVSEDTVKARLEKCRQKLGASNTTHAIAIALLNGLLSGH